MLSQLMVLFGFFSLVLVLIYWINRAVRLFDQLIADGQNAVVFLEFTALSLPSVIGLALPLAAFAASIYVTNRMSAESELTVVKATGFSPWRLARPVFYFGLIVAVLMSILVHVLIPMSTARLAEREADLAQNITARLLTEGQFIEPANGITFYIREVTPDGELRDIFLADNRDPAREVTYTASQAFLVRDQSDTQLVMIDGLVQTVNTQSQRLFTTSFADFAFNIGDIIGQGANDRRRAAHLFTPELLHPTQTIMDETRQSAARLLARANDRVVQSLLGGVGALLGFACMIVGGFSRFGAWRQIVIAILLIVLVKGIETVGMDAARDDADLWFVAYTSTAVGLVMVACLLFWASRPYLLKRRPQGISSI